MTAAQTLNNISRFLFDDKAKQYKQSKSLYAVLEKLKKKEIILKEKLKNEKNEGNLRLIKLKLAVIYAKRKKGINAIKQLKTSLTDKVITKKPSVIRHMNAPLQLRHL